MRTAESHAVLARIEVTDDGVTLVLEDMKGGGSSWSLDALFTNQTFAKDEFLNVTLSPAQLQDVGLNLVTRLAVFHHVRQQGHRPKPEKV